MAATEGVIVVLDAGPLIHLDELNCHRVLEGFEKLLIPSAVWNEATRHRPLLSLLQIPHAHITDPRGMPPLKLAGVNPVAELHVGEIAALTLLHEAGGGLLLSDDEAARRTAEALGYSVSGTLGLLLRGVRRKLISSAEVQAIARDLRARTTLHISRAVLARFAAAIPD